jgi:hypothetical protein
MSHGRAACRGYGKILFRHLLWAAVALSRKLADELGRGRDVKQFIPFRSQHVESASETNLAEGNVNFKLWREHAPEVASVTPDFWGSHPVPRHV